jgi:hypothetical protein
MRRQLADRVLEHLGDVDELAELEHLITAEFAAAVGGEVRAREILGEYRQAFGADAEARFVNHQCQWHGAGPGWVVLVARQIRPDGTLRLPPHLSKLPPLLVLAAFELRACLDDPRQREVLPAVAALAPAKRRRVLADWSRQVQVFTAGMSTEKRRTIGAGLRQIERDVSRLAHARAHRLVMPRAFWRRFTPRRRRVGHGRPLAHAPDGSRDGGDADPDPVVRLRRARRWSSCH